MFKVGSLVFDPCGYIMGLYLLKSPKGDSFYTEIEHAIIMQCVEVRGCEIYEGDISTLNSRGLYVCKWSNKYTALKWEEKDLGKVDCEIFNCGNMTYFCGELDYKKIEIIGNIYENPGLLEKNHETKQ